MMNEYGITAEQYQAGVAKLWKALGDPKADGIDVFTKAASRIEDLEAKLNDGKWIGDEFVLNSN